MSVEGLGLSVEGKNGAIALRSNSAPQPSTLNTQPSRGMTLIELLVVIVVMTTIVAAAIPLMSPNNDDRRMREAARGLNTFVTGAQTRAIASNRPFGFAIKRLSHDTKRADDRGVSLEVYYVEQPAPYAGFDPNSRACVAIDPRNPPPIPDSVLIRFVTRGAATAGLPMGWTVDLFPNSVLRPGDIIAINGTRFELKGPYPGLTRINLQTGYFEQINTNRAAIIVARPANNSGQQINPRYDDNGNEIGAVSPLTAPYWTLPSPYKVLRQPTPASDEPYQLPEGVAIDLRASGVGVDDYFYAKDLNDNDDGMIVMFAPEGRVARVMFNQYPHDSVPFDKAVVDNVFLLIGRRENAALPVAADPTLDSSQVHAATTDQQRAKLREQVNWMLGTGRWVVIGSQSGRIATIDNGHFDPADFFDKYTAAPYDLPPASEELRNEQIKSAREYTHEMSQLGGR
jgi:prepilin-type N-terminal cleavage/methylation domain-containing protein